MDEEQEYAYWASGQWAVDAKTYTTSANNATASSLTVEELLQTVKLMKFGETKPKEETVKLVTSPSYKFLVCEEE